MEEEQKYVMRKSPYLQKNLQKYKPSSIISADGKSRNQLLIQSKNIELKSFISYVNYKAEEMGPLVEEQCYFCRVVGSGYTRCGDCNRVVCQKCLFSCQKCSKILCQFDRNYDYTTQQNCCFDC